MIYLIYHDSFPILMQTEPHKYNTKCFGISILTSKYNLKNIIHISKDVFINKETYILHWVFINYIYIP